MNPEDEAEEDGANIDLDSQRKGKCVVLKTSTRQVNHHVSRVLADFMVTVVESYEFNSSFSLVLFELYASSFLFESLPSLFPPTVVVKTPHSRLFDVCKVVWEWEITF